MIILFGDMMVGHPTRRAWHSKPAISWQVVGNNPREGIEHIIDKLKERYNPFMTGEGFGLVEPYVREQIIANTRVVVHVRKGGAYYGNVAIVYRGAITDRSTFEHKPAQIFHVYFNMRDKGYEERHHFCRQNVPS